MTDRYVRSTDGSDADDGSTWALADATLVAGAAASANTDRTFVSDAHAETQGSAMTITCPATPGYKIICGDDVAEPPTAVAATGSVTVTGSFDLFINGFAYIYGVLFTAGSGATNRAAFLGNAATPHGLNFDTCKFVSPGSTSTILIALGPVGSVNNDDVTINLKNPTFKFSVAGQPIALRHGRFATTNATIDSSGVAPTTLIGTIAATAGSLVDEASDWSGEAFTNAVNVSAASVHDIEFRGSKFPTSVVLATGTFPGPGGTTVRAINCQANGAYIKFWEERYEGTVLSQAAIYVTGGASEDGGTTNEADKMVSRSGNTAFDRPLYGSWLTLWNSTVGSAITVTVPFVHDSATALKDDEIWLECEYLGTASSLLKSFITDRATNILTAGANQASSSVTWNGHAFGNENKQAVSVSVTPQKAGFLRARVALAKNNYTIYHDDKLTIS